MTLKIFKISLKNIWTTNNYALIATKSILQYSLRTVFSMLFLSSSGSTIA